MRIFIGSTFLSLNITHKRKKPSKNEERKFKIPTNVVSDIKTRLKTLSGQINGIVKMLDEGKTLSK